MNKIGKKPSMLHRFRPYQDIDNKLPLFQLNYIRPRITQTFREIEKGSGYRKLRGMGTFEYKTGYKENKTVFIVFPVSNSVYLNQV